MADGLGSKPLRVLVACEYSGTVRDAFIGGGHDAMSCDLLPTDVPGPHYMGDVRDLLIPGRWDLMIGHPECTYLSSSGLHWNGRVPGRTAKTEAGLDFVRSLLAAPVPHIAIENRAGSDSGQNRLPPSPDRWKLRSKTYVGIAAAMADQWGSALVRANVGEP